MSLARFWEATGDIFRDMQALFDDMGISFTQKEIGALGTVQLYVAERP
ncbi:MAG: hypothetical protein P8X95_12045 [Anaerolineales bacterium]|jgi:hypothetical protein